MITGMYQTTIGPQPSKRAGERKIHLPGEVVPVPVLFQAAGYFTSNGDYPKKREGLGKTITTLSGTNPCTTLLPWGKR